MLDDWRGLRTFRSLPPHRRAIVFYSEGRHDWPHLAPLVNYLTRDMCKDICYVASEKDDPGLALNDDHITGIRIGQGTARTVFFLLLEAHVMVMTMSDLNTYHIKRSIHPVHYVYVCHSMASNHMSGRPGSIDHYDTIFCVGPHHVQEIRETEALYGLAAKELFEHGYGRLDLILDRARQDFDPQRRASVARAHCAVLGSGGHTRDLRCHAGGRVLGRRISRHGAAPPATEAQQPRSARFISRAVRRSGPTGLRR